MAVTTMNPCPCVQRNGSRLLPVHTANRRVSVISSTHNRRKGGTSNASSTISITVAAAASTLLAKVSALAAFGISSGLLLSSPIPTTAKPSEKQASLSYVEPTTRKVTHARAPIPAAADFPALPRSWEVATSAAHWLELNRQATSAGVLLATVFISDKAARVHGPLLERMRAAHGTGPGAPVRFVYVHVGPNYDQRRRACSAAGAVARGSSAMSLGHLSYAAAHHGLDVALSALMPDGLRAFPSLMLTAGPAAADGSSHCAATTRTTELTQLVADMAFINRRRAASVPQRVSRAAMQFVQPVAGGVKAGEGAVLVGV